jgi:carbon starvation protein
VPTRRFVLWGHHFTSVAGAAPIVGPAIAVIWGWVPAFLWVVLGTIFFAGVHDAGALWASARNKAKSVGALTEDIVGARARSIFMIVIFLLLLMVNAVFATLIANLFVSVPSSVLSAWGVIGVALVIGFLIYRRGVPLLWPSVIGVVILYALVFSGSSSRSRCPQVMGLGPRGSGCCCSSPTPASPRCCRSGCCCSRATTSTACSCSSRSASSSLAVLLANPTIVAPAFNPSVPAGTPPLVPLLFVTIACGAISGFHGLVSSGTTSKQLDKETGRPAGRLSRRRRRGRTGHRIDRGLHGRVRDARRVADASTARSPRAAWTPS